MAFSLEATLVVPCILGCCLGLVTAASTLYTEVWQAAKLETAAASQAIDSVSLYHADSLSFGDAWTTRLMTSPQVMDETISLITDNGRLLLRVLKSAGFSGHSADDSGPWS